MFEKFFIKRKDSAESRHRRVLGRYSDNNKSLAQSEEWLNAEKLFQEKKYLPSFRAFFNYIRDEHIQNINVYPGEKHLAFELYQGSATITGRVDEKNFVAEAGVVMMAEPVVAVMRRLLEQNVFLNYSRFTIQDQKVYLLFDSPTENASPEKIFYGLKEMANLADRQDDLLLHEFRSLQPLPTLNRKQYPAHEKEVRYTFLKKTVAETLDFVKTLDQDLLAPGISYILLALGYRIDFLITPDALLRQELEEIIGIYFNTEDISLVEKNALMIKKFSAWRDKKEPEVFACLYDSVSVFSIVNPQPSKAVNDVLGATLQNVAWFISNKHYEIARHILEYGISHCQYSFSLPRPLTEIYQVFMQVNYAGYFRTLGFEDVLYDPETNHFNERAIRHLIDDIISDWSEKYPLIRWNTHHIRYDSVLNFNYSFLEEFRQLQV